jgi:hypothetical protein
MATYHTYSTEPLPVFTDATRPDASTVAVGLQIWNSSAHAPQWSDGTVWRDLDGHAT